MLFGIYFIIIVLVTPILLLYIATLYRYGCYKMFNLPTNPYESEFYHSASSFSENFKTPWWQGVIASLLLTILWAPMTGGRNIADIEQADLHVFSIIKYGLILIFAVWCFSPEYGLLGKIAKICVCLAIYLFLDVEYIGSVINYMLDS